MRNTRCPGWPKGQYLARSVELRTRDANGANFSIDLDIEDLRDGSSVESAEVRLEWNGGVRLGLSAASEGEFRFHGAVPRYGEATSIVTSPGYILLRKPVRLPADITGRVRLLPLTKFSVRVSDEVEMPSARIEVGIRSPRWSRPVFYADEHGERELGHRTTRFLPRAGRHFVGWFPSGASYVLDFEESEVVELVGDEFLKMPAEREIRARSRDSYRCGHRRSRSRPGRAACGAHRHRNQAVFAPDEASAPC